MHASRRCYARVGIVGGGLRGTSSANGVAIPCRKVALSASRLMLRNPSKTGSGSMRHCGHTSLAAQCAP